MNDTQPDERRRSFLKTAMIGAVGALLPHGPAKAGTPHSGKILQVWSCGGLAEAFMAANTAYERVTGVKISYTGAFAAALGKSLLGSATTEVFAGRVLDLAKKLKSAGKMVSYRPLCYTSYVMVTPLGNPAAIKELADMARPGVRVILAPEASLPGGLAVQNLLKKAGLAEAVTKNCLAPGSCVQRIMADVVAGGADVSIVERRLTKRGEFRGKVEVVDIPEEFFPPGPLTFTIGAMKHAADQTLAEHYIEYVTSTDGQNHFLEAGFIPALSAKGQQLTEKLGVKDV